MIRCIIIDDEENNRQMIGDLILKHCPELSIVSEADGVARGIDAIQKHHPDLVFLDIKMDDGDGFELLEKLGSIDFKVIFITFTNLWKKNQFYTCKQSKKTAYE